MRKIPFGSSGLDVPPIAIGCMRLTSLDKKGVNTLINTCIDAGANFFDHADIYGGGSCESLFADAVGMNPTVREKMIIQSKCGIRSGMFDFSKEHILNSVDGILKRLKTDYLDALLLHRPDTLCEPEEVAETFDILKQSGKVRNFGMSNQKPMQIDLLKKYLNVPIVANQLQFSLTNLTMVSNGINVNMENNSAIDRDGSVLDYCRLNDITIQPWSPFQYGFFEGTYLGNAKFPKLNEKIDELAEKYNVTNNTIVIAWMLRHPAKMQPITGTMNLARIIDIFKATEITLTREEWYELYRAAGNILP